MKPDDKRKEVEMLIDKAVKTPMSVEALQFSQAACNAANAMACVVNTELARSAVGEMDCAVNTELARPKDT